MRRRLLAIHVGLVVVLTLGGCGSPVAQACPMCEHPMGPRDDGPPTDSIYTVDEEPVPVATTATVEIAGNGTVAWTVVADLDLGDGDAIATPSTIEQRLQRRLQRADGFDGEVRTLGVRTETDHRVIVSATVEGTAVSAPGDVVVYHGFTAGEAYGATVVNADELIVQGPGESVFTTGAVGETTDRQLRYERGDHIDPDTIVVAGLEPGVRGAVQLRSAFASYNVDLLPRALALSLVLAAVVAAALLRFGRGAGESLLDSGLVGAERSLVVPFFFVAALVYGGWGSGVTPVAGVGIAFATVLSLWAVSARIDAGSLRSSVRTAPTGARTAVLVLATILGTACIGAALAAVSESMATADGTIASGPPAAIATPAAVGLDLGVWSTLVAIPLAFGTAGDLSRRRRIAGAIGVGGAIALVLLAWWWPLVAPISLAWGALFGALALGVLAGIATVAYGIGYAIQCRRPGDDREPPTASRSP